MIDISVNFYDLGSGFYELIEVDDFYFEGGLWWYIYICIIIIWDNLCNWFLRESVFFDCVLRILDVMIFC